MRKKGILLYEMVIGCVALVIFCVIAMGVSSFINAMRDENSAGAFASSWKVVEPWREGLECRVLYINLTPVGVDCREVQE